MTFTLYIDFPISRREGSFAALAGILGVAAVTMRALPGRLAAAGVAGARVVRRRSRLPALHRVPELDHATLLLRN